MGNERLTGETGLKGRTFPMAENPFPIPAKGSTSSAIVDDQAAGSMSIHEALKDGPEPVEEVSGPSQS